MLQLDRIQEMFVSLYLDVCLSLKNFLPLFVSITVGCDQPNGSDIFQKLFKLVKYECVVCECVSECVCVLCVCCASVRVCAREREQFLFFPPS
jgi:hypothetical protein